MLRVLENQKMKNSMKLVWTFVLAATGAFAASEKAGELPDFSLTAVTTESSRPFAKKDLLGKYWVADFIFTHCTGPCPFTTARMQGLQKRLPKTVDLLTFTVDPNRDHPDVLAKYAAKYDADPSRWLFVTGPNEEALIPLFRDGFGTAVKADPKSSCGYTTWHSAKFFLIGPDGRILHQYTSTEPSEIDRLEKDARALVKSGGARS
jgi:protein SCO1/2